jgi:hypothetical protein
MPRLVSDRGIAYALPPATAFFLCQEGRVKDKDDIA